MIADEWEILEFIPAGDWRAVIGGNGRRVPLCAWATIRHRITATMRLTGVVPTYQPNAPIALAEDQDGFLGYGTGPGPD